MAFSELAVSADLDFEKPSSARRKRDSLVVEGRKAYGRHSGGCGKAGLDTVEGFRCVGRISCSGGVGWGEAEAVTVSAVETDGRAVSVSAARRSAP